MADSIRTLNHIAQADAPSTPESHAQGVVQIVTPELDASLAFYHKLAFALERQTGRFAVVGGFGVWLFLAEDPGAPVVPRRGNLRIVVADVDEISDLVRQAGLPRTREVGDRSYGLRDFAVVDPAGFEIPFAQLL